MHPHTLPAPEPQAAPALAPETVRLTRWHVLALVAVIAGCAGLTGLLAWQPWRPGAELVGGAADAIDAAPAVRLGYVYVGADGQEVSGAFTVTADGYASGTVADPGSGEASLVATPEGSAVYGDGDWWLRRAPDRVGRVRDQWVQPDAGAAFPLDVTSALNPSAVADLMREVSSRGTVLDDESTVDGVPVVTVVSGDWELQLTREAPARVVSLAGPIESGGLHPSADTGPGTHIVPVALEGPGSGSIALSPEPADEPGAAKAKSDASGTMSGKGTTPPGMTTPSAPPGKSEAAPPKAADLPPQQPRFETELHSSDCNTPTCSWSVTTTNTGNAPGSGIAYSGAIPVVPPIARPIGRLAPGASTTSTFSAANPAPPGGRIQVTVIAGSYCAELHGQKPEPYERLLGKGVDPAKALPNLDKAFTPLAVEAMNKMIDGGADGETVNKAMAAVERYHLEPALLDLNAAGGDFSGFGAIAQGLASANGHNETMRVVDAVDFARDLLGRSPGSTVGLTAPKDAKGKEWVAEVKSGADNHRYVLTTATTRAELVNVLNNATALLKPGDDGTVRIRVERASGEGADSLWREDWPGLQSHLHQKNGGINVCRGGGGGGLGTLVVSNRLGDHSLTTADFCAPETDPAKLKTPRHNKARDKVTEFLKEYLERNGVKGTVGERELIVPNGSKKGTGNNGYVDDWMVDANNVLHIWEVKAEDEAWKGPGELAWYRQKLLETGEYADVVLGFPLGELLTEPGVLPTETLEIQDWDGTRSGRPTGEDPLGVILYRALH